MVGEGYMHAGWQRVGAESGREIMQETSLSSGDLLTLGRI